MLLVTHASGCGSFFKIRIQSEQFVGKSIPGSSRLPLPDIHAHFILNIPRFGRVAALLFSFLRKPECLQRSTGW
jgi:hypothetical protein